MHYVLWNNDLMAWAIALGVGTALCIFLMVLKALLVQRLDRLAAATETYLDDVAVKVLSATNLIFFLVIAIYVGAQWLDIPDKKMTSLEHLTAAVVLLQAARWGDVGVKTWLQFYRQRRIAEDIGSTTSTAALGFVSRTALWLVALLMILENFGVNITTLVASLGIGGIAVALALQNILGDLFSSLSIVLDKPFVVGDFITVDTISGTVEHVGLKTTRIRSLSGEQIVFSNSDLLKSRIRNYKRMETRRIVFGISVAYEVSEEQLQMIPGMLREAVEAQPQAKFDRAHFKAYTPSSLDFEIVYIVQAPEYALYMDIQQEINFILFKRFRSAGIPFASPTQTISIANEEIHLASRRARPEGEATVTDMTASRRERA